ncbi:hypothetical protein SanaruYs_37470 [Chryseotalea sanaruensis]|uniref:Uncharacterized protein n=1 Tax=Chryseotalea sanaruensis TaxID=2482724 RepID=A0A401UF52_9BACT|nr:amidohydrolase family protein [Chryseotalea sanaruensis]GCC53502.1 hypothetical protein SanaruYs_37470 [Chryseotalea sanaruensis]
MDPEKLPLTNCHTHIFKADHVPPWLSKSYLPFGTAYLINTAVIVGLFRAWYKLRDYFVHKISWLERARRIYAQIVLGISQNTIIKIVFYIVGLWISLQVLFFLFDLLAQYFPVGDSTEKSWLQVSRDWLTNNGILVETLTKTTYWILVVVVLLFVKSGRNLILFLLKRFFKFFALLPGKETTKFISRYVLVGRFAFYKNQRDIFGRLTKQYPQGSRFIVLPMDMEFMGAGLPRESYAQQMNELVSIKQDHPSVFLPFVFVDPRRITAQKLNNLQKDFFSYRIGPNKEILLQDCDMRDYLEKYGFNGFKIYPALGYYPFDEHLLPVWKYAVDHDLPIITHCIRGTIFYRGKKKSEWNMHPVFKEKVGNDEMPMLLKERKNREFSINFTHPLNYLCLLKEPLLRIVVGNAKDPRIKEMFGFTDFETPLLNNLNDLKICFGHYGGEDEWLKYLEADRDTFSRALISKPNGIDFMRNSNGQFSHDKLAQMWKSTDWYSIISSLILQHPNVYADISYTLHDAGIWPLLSDTLDRPKLEGETRNLAEGILYGTDFYVVRNHKSEKQLFAELKFNLSTKNVDIIARDNPMRFVK